MFGIMAASEDLLTYLTSATQRVTSQTSAESYKKDVVLESSWCRQLAQRPSLPVAGVPNKPRYFESSGGRSRRTSSRLANAGCPRPWPGTGCLGCRWAGSARQAGRLGRDLAYIYCCMGCWGGICRSESLYVWVLSGEQCENRWDVNDFMKRLNKAC